MYLYDLKMREGCGGEERVSEEDDETEDGSCLPFVLLQAHHHQPPHGAHLTEFKLTRGAFYLPLHQQGSLELNLPLTNQQHVM